MSVPATVSTSFTLPALQAWGERFGANFGKLKLFNDPEEGPGQVVVLLSGELGAGKTTLAQSICRGFGVTEEVTSPTFALVHRYQGKAPVFHVDLYRLRGPEELANVGWDDLLNETGLLLIEWPGRAGKFLPPGLTIHLAHDPEHPDSRILTVGSA